MAAAKVKVTKPTARKPLPGFPRDKRLCFVIMPFGTKSDAAAKDTVDFDKVYKEIIAPAVESLEDRGIHIECLRSDEVEQAGLIHERMIGYIADADVAVVDITTSNPNVFYELGVRHALRDRVTVLIRREKTQNPFNIGGMTTLTYSLDKKKAPAAIEAIANYIGNGLLSGNRDSLVHTMLPDLKMARPRKWIDGSDVEEYRFAKLAHRRIGMVTGNLRHINLNAKLHQRPIDVWVSSENINMEMARPYDGSISGMIRYLGARKDETSNIVEDVVADELKATMKTRQYVNPGEVVPTRAGRLTETHKVKRILHAAAVYGVVGSGYIPIAEVHQCITNALARLDFDAKLPALPGSRLEKDSDPFHTSVLFPLLGTGTGRAEVIQSARKQIGAALSYLRSRARFTVLRRIYFLAPDEVHRDAMRVVFAELGGERAVVPGASPRSQPAAAKHYAAARPLRAIAARRPRPKPRKRPTRTVR